MAVCKMEMLAVGRDVGLGGVRGRQEAGVVCEKPQLLQQRVWMRSASALKRWPPVVGVGVVVSAHRVALQPTCAKFRLRCNATSGDGDNADPSRKGFDLSEVVEKVIHEEENQLPAEEKESTPEPLPEGVPSPFSPADENTDDPFAGGEEEIHKDSLVMPSKSAAATPAASESAASSSIGEGLGVSEQSTLVADPLGGSSVKRDWRVYASNYGLDDIFENEGGNSVDDYKLRAHIFEESAAFFTALKNRESSSVV